MLLKMLLFGVIILQHNFPDARSATVTIKGKETPVYEAVNDDNWLKNEFVSVCKKIHRKNIYHYFDFRLYKSVVLL